MRERLTENPYDYGLRLSYLANRSDALKMRDERRARRVRRVLSLAAGTAFSVLWWFAKAWFPQGITGWNVFPVAVPFWTVAGGLLTNSLENAFAFTVLALVITAPIALVHVFVGPGFAQLLAWFLALVFFPLLSGEPDMWWGEKGKTKDGDFGPLPWLEYRRHNNVLQTRFLGR